MRVRYVTILFLGLLIINGLSVFGQSQITKSEIAKICSEYHKEVDSLTLDPSHSTTYLSTLADSPVVQYFALLSQYYDLKHFNLKPYPMGFKIVKKKGKNYTCRFFNNDTLVTTLDVEHIGDSWMVVGYNGDQIKLEHQQNLRHLVDSLTQIKQLEDSITELVKRYYDWLDRYYDTGKIDTTIDFSSYLVEVIILDDEIRKYAPHKEHQKYVVDTILRFSYQNENILSCDVKFENKYSEQLFLLYENGKWVVIGSFDLLASMENIKAKKQELHAVKERVALSYAIDSLNKHFNQFLYSGDESLFRSQTSEEVLSFFGPFRHYLGSITNTNLKFREFDNGYHRFYYERKNDSNFSFDTTEYTAIVNERFYTLEFKKDSIWRISKAKFGDEYADKRIQFYDQFGHYKDIFIPYYSRYSNDDDMLDDLIEISDDTDDNSQFIEPKDTHIYSRFTDFNSEPRSTLETMTFFKLLDSLSGRDRSKPVNLLKQTVFVQFVVEIDGSISEANVLSSPNEILSKKALKILTKLPPWMPAIQKKYFEDGASIPLRSRYILPICF